MNWEARDEFVEKMFRRSGSVYSRRYYGFGVDNFRKFCEGAGIGEVDGKNATGTRVKASMDATTIPRIKRTSFDWRFMPRRSWAILD